MKRILLIFLVLAACTAVRAQTHPYTLTTYGDCKGSFWANTDTLVDSESIQNIIRVKGNNVMDLTFQVVFQELSGAATATLTWLGSNDGVTFVAIGAASASTGTESVWANVDDFNYSYIKLLMTVTGTETSTFNCFYSFREE
jgi:hypothetical protein